MKLEAIPSPDAGPYRPRLIPAVRVAAVILLVLVGRATAQPVTTDPAIEELRVRPPAGAADDQIIDTWLNKRVDQVKSASNAAQAGQEFVDLIKKLRLATDSTSGFLDALARRLGVKAETELKKGATLPVPVADTLLRAMEVMNDKATLPGQIAALSYPAARIKYLGAKALQDLRDGLQPAEMQNAMTALRQAGVAESNGVVAERIYSALGLRNPTADALNAIADILEARVERYRNGALFNDRAETTLAEYLISVQVPQTQSARLVPPLATLLRIDVERYLDPATPEEFDTNLQLRIDAVERAIIAMTGLNAGDVRGRMQSGGLDAEIQLALLNWIGDATTTGALNSAPWNVARGAP